MTANDVVVLEGHLARHRAEHTPQLSPTDHHTFFTAEQYLKNLRLNHEELLAGIIDGEKDCGIDAMYLFANSLCIKDDTPLKGLGNTSAWS